MQDVTIRVLDGPMQGQVFEREVGEVVLGRQPPDSRKDVELKGANTSVSRAHAVLVEREGRLALENRSPNGTKVNGKLIVEDVVIEPDAIIEIGDQFRLQVHWQTFGGEAQREQDGKTGKKKKKKGALASPVVRIVLGVYLAGIVALAIWLALGSDEAQVADDWPDLLVEYEAWQDPATPAEVWDARERRGEMLVRELRLMKTQGLSSRQETICRELMTIDADSRSPLYRFGARCLSSL